MAPAEPKPREERPPLEWIRANLGPILIVILGGVILISLVHGWAEAHLAHWDKVVGKAANLGDPDTKGLSGVTWIEPLPVRPDQTMYWRTELRNGRDEAIRVSMGDLWHPGWVPAEAKGSSVLVRSSQTGAGRVWADWDRVLEPGEETAFWTSWTPAPDGGEEETSWTRWLTGKSRALGLSAVLEWQAEAGSQSRGSVIVSLRDIHVVTPWRAFWAHAMRCFVALLGILTVPVVIALAGFWFQQHQQSVERQRQEKQAEIDHQRQIWAKMLPTSHELNMKYYIPLKSTITTLQRDCERYHDAVTGAKESVDEELDSAFHYLLVTLRQFRLITTEAGGFYFKNREGERLFTQLVNQFNFQVLSRLQPYEDLSTLLDVLKPQDTVSTFGKKLEEQKELEEKYSDLREHFREWLGGDHQWVFGILFSAKLLLGFEVNSVYTDWYEEPERWPQEINGLLMDWRKQDDSEATQDLLCRIQEYGKQVRAHPQDRGWHHPA